MLIGCICASVTFYYLLVVFTNLYIPIQVFSLLPYLLLQIHFHTFTLQLISQIMSKCQRREAIAMHEVNEILYHQFKMVFDQHYNTLCNYALALLKDPSASEDVVQEVFIRIWEKRRDIITSETIRFYLFTAVRNNCLTHLQKERKAAIVAFNDCDDAEESMAFPEEVKTESDYKSQLASAMDQLPPKCREVFLLSRMSKQSYKEIADTLDISVKTVENQIGKALKILRIYVKEKKLFLVILILIICLFG